MFLTMFFKTQNIEQTMHLTMLIAHPYPDSFLANQSVLSKYMPYRKNFPDFCKNFPGSNATTLPWFFLLSLKTTFVNSVAALPAPNWSVNLGQGIETEYPLHMISREGDPSSVGGLLESVPAEKYKILELNLPVL